MNLKLISSLSFVLLLVMGGINSHNPSQITSNIYWESFYGIMTKLLCGIIISCLFYFLFVEFPQNKQKHIIKKAAVEKYKTIRRNILREFVRVSIAGGRTDLDMSTATLSRLIKPTEFKKEFTGETTNQGIYPFRNEIDQSEKEFKRIIFELKLLGKELGYITHSYEISDETLYEKVKRLEDKISELEFVGIGYVEEKQLTMFLYEMFTGFSFVDGGKIRDPFLELLEEL